MKLSFELSSLWKNNDFRDVKNNAIRSCAPFVKRNRFLHSYFSNSNRLGVSNRSVRQQEQLGISLYFMSRLLSHAFFHILYLGKFQNLNLCVYVSL